MQRTLLASLCETDSPDTGEVTRKRQRGSRLLAEPEGESLAVTRIFE